MSWWRKNADELKEAFQEINRSKVGRLSRLRGTTEAARVQYVLPPLPLVAESLSPSSIAFCRRHALEHPLQGWVAAWGKEGYFCNFSAVLSVVQR